LADGEELVLGPVVDAALSGDWSPLLLATTGETALVTKPSAPLADEPIASAVEEAADPAYAPHLGPAEGADATVRAAAPAPAPTDPSSAFPAAAGALAAPPCPPFETAPAPFRWEAEVWSRLKKRYPVRVGDDGIELGGTLVRYDEIEHGLVKMKRDPMTGFSVTISVTPRGGTPVAFTARPADTPRQRAAAQVGRYVWTLLVRRVAPGLVRRLVERIRSGETVSAGGLALSPAGIGTPGASPVPWAEVGEVRAARSGIVIDASGSPMYVVKEGAEDAFLLPALVPQLRALFA
jgi:hypothetical protein